MRTLIRAASLLMVCSAVWAGPRGMSGEAPPPPTGEILNPAVQAGPYESQYGMAPQHKNQFNLGARITVDNLKARPFMRDGSRQPDDTLHPSPIKEEAGLSPTGRRSLVDAPISPPLPALHTPPPAAVPVPVPGRFGQAVRAAPSEIGSTVLTPAAPVSRRALENLKKPAVFSATQLPGFTPETAMEAGQADYGRRVIGEAGRAPVAVPGQMPVAAPLGAPFPVLVELRLNGQTGSPAAAAEALGAETGFVVDAAFPLLASSPNRHTAFLRGWVDSEKLMALTLSPRVVRVSVAGGAAPQSPQRLLEVPVTLHLALPAQESVSSFIGRSVAGLERQAGFRWRVSRGYQLSRSATGGTVVLTGELPAASVDRLLAYPELLRVEPYVAPAEPFDSFGSAQDRSAQGKPPAVPAKPKAPGALHKAADLVVLTTAFPWMGILVREIYFWIQLALY